MYKGNYQALEGREKNRLLFTFKLKKEQHLDLSVCLFLIYNVKFRVSTMQAKFWGNKKGDRANHFYTFAYSHFTSAYSHFHFPQIYTLASRMKKSDNSFRSYDRLKFAFLHTDNFLISNEVASVSVKATVHYCLYLRKKALLEHHMFAVFIM